MIRSTHKEEHRIHPRKPKNAVAVLTAVAVGGLVGWAGLADANTQPGPSGVVATPVAKVTVEGPIRVSMHRGTEVTTTRIKVEAGGHTAWHYHPGPHVVAVTTGEVKIYETDCEIRRTFGAGQGFFDPGTARPAISMPSTTPVRRPPKW